MAMADPDLKWPCTDHKESTVDRKHYSGNPTRLIAGQIDGRMCDIPACSLSLQRHALAASLAGILPKMGDYGRPNGSDYKAVGPNALCRVVSRD